MHGAVGSDHGFEERCTSPHTLEPDLSSHAYSTSHATCCVSFGTTVGVLSCTIHRWRVIRLSGSYGEVRVPIGTAGWASLASRPRRRLALYRALVGAAGRRHDDALPVRRHRCSPGSGSLTFEYPHPATATTVR